MRTLPARMTVVRAMAALGLVAVVVAGSPAAGDPAESTIRTFAGGGIGDGRPGLETEIQPLSVAADTAGNVYWTESTSPGGGRVRMWDAATGDVRTVAGSGNGKNPLTGRLGEEGPARNAMLHNPFGIEVDSKGNVYIVDTGNALVRRVDAATGTISTVYKGVALPTPSAIAIDLKDRVLIGTYSSVLRYDPMTGQVQTVAGGGTLDVDEQRATSVRVGEVVDVETDEHGNIYFAEDRRIRWVDTEGFIHTLAGRYPVSNDENQYAFLWNVRSGSHHLMSQPDGSLWFSEVGGIRRIAGEQDFWWIPGSRRVTSVQLPVGFSEWDAYPGGGIVVANAGSYTIHIVRDGVATQVVGNGSHVYAFQGDGVTATETYLAEPCSAAVAPSGDVYVTDQGHYRIRRIDADTGVVSTAVGTGTRGSGGDGGAAAEAAVDRPCALLVAPDGDLYIADDTARVVRRVEAETGVIVRVAGTGEDGSSGDGGPAIEARLRGPRGLAMDASGNLYIADTADNRIRMVATDGTITAVAGTGAKGFAGDGGPARLAQLNAPRGVALLQDGSLVFADTGNNRIRKVTPDGRIETIAGQGEPKYSGDGGPWLEAQFWAPNGITVDPATQAIFVADSGNNRLRQLHPDGTVRLVAGNGDGDFCGDGGAAAEACLWSPLDADLLGGDVLVSDPRNLRIRMIEGAE